MTRALVSNNNGGSVETTEYPIETDRLQKGSIVAAEIIERAFSVKRGTDAYQLAAMRAIDHIASRLRERGEIVTVVQRKHDVVILTDTEASEHNASLFQSRIRSAARAHVRQLGVDRSQLDPEKLAGHDRALETQGRVLSAIRRARRLPQPQPTRRATPAIAAGSARTKKSG